MSKEMIREKSTKHERRSIDPYVMPTGLDGALRATRLQIGDNILAHGETKVFSADAVAGDAFLSVCLDAEILTNATQDWVLTEEDLRVVILTEVPFLGLLDVQKFGVEGVKSNESVDAYRAPLPDWALESIGRGRVVVRVYLVAEANALDASSGFAVSKGTALATWQATLLGLQTVNWFKPRILTPEVRKSLEDQIGQKISPAALAFVKADNLLVQGELADCVTCYVNPGVAAFLDSMSASPAVELVESQIQYLVLDRIFESVCAELHEERPITIRGIAAEPLIELLADLQKMSVDELLEQLRGGPLQRECLKSQLQQAAGLTRFARAAMRGE